MLRGLNSGAVGRLPVGPATGRPPAAFWGKEQWFLLGSEEA